MSYFQIYFYTTRLLFTTEEPPPDGRGQNGSFKALRYWLHFSELAVGMWALPEQVQEPEPGVRDSGFVQVFGDQSSIFIMDFKVREGRAEGQEQQPERSNTNHVMR